MRKILIVALLVCLFSGCSDRSSTTPDKPAPPPVQFSPDYTNFTLPDLEDKPRSIKSWAGRPLVLNFWATWCGPCRREMPLLQRLHEQQSDNGLQVIGIAVDSPANVKPFIRNSSFTYPVLYGEEEGTLIAESFGSAFIGLPFTAFLTADGDVFKLVAGELHAEQLNQIIAELSTITSGKQQ